MLLSSLFTLTTIQELYSSNHQRDVAFMERLWRCNSLLHFLAYRILGTQEESGDAVENCRIVASRNPPDLKYEGAFRSWVARILIDETLPIVRQRNAALTKLPQMSRPDPPIEKRSGIDAIVDASTTSPRWRPKPLSRQAHLSLGAE